METYSRYKDSTGRLLVILKKWYKVVENTTVPSTLDILIVNEEREVNYTVTEFEKWINKKLITRVNN